MLLEYFVAIHLTFKLLVVLFVSQQFIFCFCVKPLCILFRFSLFNGSVVFQIWTSASYQRVFITANTRA